MCGVSVWLKAEGGETAIAHRSPNYAAERRSGSVGKLLVSEEYFERGSIEENQSHFFDVRELGQGFAQCPGNDRCGLLWRVTVYAGGEGREGDAGQSKLTGETNGIAVASGKQCGFFAAMGALDRADGMDDIVGGQGAARRGNYLAGRQAVWPMPAPDFTTGREDGRAAPAMDGAIDPAATEQAAVGSIDDGVDPLFGEVTNQQADAIAEKVVVGIGHRCSREVAPARHATHFSRDGKKQRLLRYFSVLQVVNYDIRKCLYIVNSRLGFIPKILRRI